MSCVLKTTLKGAGSAVVAVTIGVGRADKGQTSVWLCARSYLATHPCRHHCGANQRGLPCGRCDRLVDDVLYDNPPFCAYRCPNKIVISPVQDRSQCSCIHIILMRCWMIVDESIGSGVICLDGRFLLRPSHFFEVIS